MRWNTLLISLLIATPFISSAAIYKWVDEEGNVNYSQEKPKETKSERMKVDTAPSIDRSTYKKPSTKTKEQTTEKTSPDTKDAEKDKKKGKSAKNNDSGCKAAKANLNTMRNSGRVRQKDKDGNVSYMSDEQKQARMKQEMDYIKNNCK